MPRLTPVLTGRTRRLDGLWRHRAFRRLWGAQAISELGNQITLVALPLTAILVLHARAVEVALLATAETLPNLAFGIPAGVWIDRIRRRPVMIAADGGRALMLASVPAAYGLGMLSLPQLYVVAVINGSLAVLFELASSSYMPSVVAPAQLVEANAKFEASRVVAWAAGPSAGGVLTTLVTAPFALLADAASFVASACLIKTAASREGKRPAAPDGSSAWHALREGARYVIGDRYLRPMLVAHALANLALGLVWSLVIVYAVRQLGLSPAQVGLVFSLGQIGGFTGAAFGRRVTKITGVGRAVVTACFFFGPATLLIAIAPRNAAVPFLVCAWIFENLARSLYGISATSIRQALVPDHLRARAAGFTTAAGTGAFPIGTALGGGLAGASGLRHAMLVGAAIGFLPFLPLLASPVRALRDLPDSPPGQDDSYEIREPTG